MEDKVILQRIKETVAAVDPTAEVWLYGSRARGEARQDSDWDILVLSSKAMLSTREESVFIDHVSDLMVETGQVIQVFAYGQEDWHKRHSITPFYQNVQHDAIRL